MDEYAVEYDEPERETIKHRHPTLPFVEITQERYVEREPGDDEFEDWGFLIRGPKEPAGHSVAYDGVAYRRGDSTEAGILAFLLDRAERHFVEERGPFFVLMIYFETGEYRKAIDDVLRKHGYWPRWMRFETWTARKLHRERELIRWRYRRRGERPNF